MDAQKTSGRSPAGHALRHSLDPRPSSERRRRGQGVRGKGLLPVTPILR
jgi:hypothetical protein